MSICKFCNNEIDWRPVPGRFKKDGSPLSVPVNLDGKDHICKNRKVKAEDWKPRWGVLNDLPVYCLKCMEYYLNTKPCSHLLELGFIPHTPEYPKESWSFPPRFGERMLRKLRDLKKRDTSKGGIDQPLKVDYEENLSNF